MRFLIATLLMACAAPAMADIAVPKGTAVKLVLKSPLGSIHSQVGERFYLALAEPVVVNGQVAIPAGSRAVGEVTLVARKGDFGKSGRLTAKLLYIYAGTQMIALEGATASSGEVQSSEVPGLAAAMLLTGGLVTGKSATIPPGTIVEAVIAEEAILPSTPAG